MDYKKPAHYGPFISVFEMEGWPGHVCDIGMEFLVLFFRAWTRKLGGGFKYFFVLNPKIGEEPILKPPTREDIADGELLFFFGGDNIFWTLTFSNPLETYFQHSWEMPGFMVSTGWDDHVPCLDADPAGL